MASGFTTTSKRSSFTTKSLCATCSELVGIGRCEGCQKIFCRKHFNDHLSELANQLDGLATEHDAFHNELNQVFADPRIHALIIRVNAWEKTSTEKIRQAADEARTLIQTHATANDDEVSKRFREMVENLKEARKNQDFDERDLKEWTKQLEQLKENFASPSSISVEEGKENFIAKIQVNEVETLGKKFEQMSGYIRIENEGLAVGCYNNYAPFQGAQVRCKGQYSGGIHKIRFKIENYSNAFLVFGMNWRAVSIQTYTCDGPTFNGWVSHANNMVYVNGQVVNNYNGYTSDFKVNDEVELELDCYRRLFRIYNNRSKLQCEMLIDLAKCPFPWAFQLVLSYNGDRLRILL